MSINATISGAYFDEMGDWRFDLEGEERGQPRLFSSREHTPEDADLLTGQHVWGSADSLMLGETKIADRLAYCVLKFVVPSIGLVIDSARMPRFKRRMGSG